MQILREWLLQWPVTSYSKTVVGVSLAVTLCCFSVVKVIGGTPPEQFGCTQALYVLLCIIAAMAGVALLVDL